ncbi:MAG TPA: hypothetical protein PLL30_02700 [Candidatus Krumholzibacteria bacterium]|nr:hypothetical protein [Candidatus Krumholzibacteria bacterium]HPD70679.1 hypothetical protein [Candidatus Krumholzibacteria bacterium]HRY39621.1 hypothetical protein [Candidatus Krumholzibacteria bacterium]
MGLASEEARRRPASRSKALLPARGPPQGELEFDQAAGRSEWADMGQTAGLLDEV